MGKPQLKMHSCFRSEFSVPLCLGTTNEFEQSCYIREQAGPVLPPNLRFARFLRSMGRLPMGPIALEIFTLGTQVETTVPYSRQQRFSTPKTAFIRYKLALSECGTRKMP